MNRVEGQNHKSLFIPTRCGRVKDVTPFGKKVKQNKGCHYGITPFGFDLKCYIDGHQRVEGAESYITGAVHNQSPLHHFHAPSAIIFATRVTREAQKPWK